MESKGPCPLRSSHHLHWALLPTPSSNNSKQAPAPGPLGWPGPPISSHPASSGGRESTASMPCRAITLYLFLGLAREAQGHGASQGPEPLAVQRLYFNVYLLQKETAFGFEPLMRKKYIELKNTVWCVTGSRIGDTRDKTNRKYTNKTTHGHRMKNWCLARLSLSFLGTQQHVGDPAADGEHPTRLRALQGALQHFHLRGRGEQS